MQVFLSCSLRPEDEEVVAWVRTICESLGMYCRTVDTATAEVPPAAAREMIARSVGVIAVATAREGTIAPAVREEVFLAYGLGKPVLPLVENGVEIGGMFGHIGTHYRFDRDRLATPKTLGAIIGAIAGFRDLLRGAGAPPRFYCELTRRLLSLEGKPGSYTWVNATTKRIRFDDFSDGRLMKRSRAGYHVDPEFTSPPMEFDVTVGGSSRPFRITPNVLAITGTTLDLELMLDPPPAAGDWVEFTTRVQSPQLNPMYGRAPLPRMIRIDDRDYAVTDGLVPIEQTRRAVQEWHFPDGYGLRWNDIRPFVATYSFATDFIAREELMRLKVTPRPLPGMLVVAMEVDNPLIGHMYGLAWNPPPPP